MSIVVNELIRLALMEIRVARAGDVVSPDDMADGLLLFNELLDAWNADGRTLFSTAFATHTLTANLQPHTIGLAANSPTFSVSVGRPVHILNANIVLTNNIRSPLHLINEQEWNAILTGAAAGQAVTMTSSIPSVLYYKDGWPNGSIYLWPVPSTAYGLELETETLLASVALTDTLTLPYGYQQALRLTLAEIFASAWGQKVSEATRENARVARAAIFATNSEQPLVLADAGVPMGGRSGTFDYRVGH